MAKFETRYVRSTAQINAIEAKFSNAKFLYEGLRAEFLTSTAFVSAVLPPGLSPADEPLAYISLGRWQSDVCGEFDTGSVFLQAKHAGGLGWYNLTMLVSGEMPVVWGREVWGEVKKHGKIGIYRDDNRYFAYAERDGQRLMKLEGVLDKTDRGIKTVADAFEIKAFPAASGKGLEYDPLLVHLRCHAEWSEITSGSGTVELASSTNDPVGEIPIESIRSMSFAVGETIYSCLGTHKLCERDQYLPYFYGRNYDAFLSMPIAARYR